MKKRPNAITHMTLWGAIAGFLLAIIYYNILFFMVFYDSSEFNYWSELLNLSLLDWMKIGVPFGLVPGLVVGIINGLFHQRLLRDIAISSPKFDSKPVYPGSFVLTTTLTITVFWSFYFPHILSYALLVIPFSVIAGLLGIFASFHYLCRLRRWSDSLYGRKSKAKIEEYYRLMDDETQAEESVTQIDEVHQEKRHS